MTALDYLVAVVPMLGILIFVHELGHFLVAKACGVRVLKFSLGFGSPIGIGRMRMRWERGGTEYVVAWFPLGGFVKMLGEQMDAVQGVEPEYVDARPDEYLSAKPTWQKLAITFAGPAMNLLLPVVAFSGVLMIGLQRPDAVVGNVEPASPAAAAGIAPGDRVLGIDGEPVRFWEDVAGAVRGHPAGTVEFRVQSAGAEVRDVRVEVIARSGMDEFGDVTRVGWVGIGNSRLPALMGVPGSESPAARAGLQSGDRVTRVGEREVETWEAFASAYAAETAEAGSVEIEVTRGGEEAAPQTLTLPPAADLRALGLIPAAILIDAVEPETPAARAGLAAGDLVLAVDGQPIGSFASFVEVVRTSGGRTLAVTVARDGVTSVAP